MRWRHAIKIEATIEYHEHWLFVDEIEIYGELSGQLCEKPVIQKDLNAFESIQTGESITLSVEASSTDGGNLVTSGLRMVYPYLGISRSILLRMLLWLMAVLIG